MTTRGDDVQFIRLKSALPGLFSLFRARFLAIWRLVEGDHDIDCKVDGIGAIMLKSKLVRKI